MANFSIKRKGYDVKEVDTYVNKISSFNEVKLKEQRNRIDTLKQENKRLHIIISGYKKKETIISEALINATKKANDVVSSSKIIYSLESERIKIFRAKWTKYVDNVIDKVSEIDEQSNMKSYLTKMDDELRSMMKEDVNIHKKRLPNEAEIQYDCERERLNDVENSSEVYNDEKSISEVYVEDIKEKFSSNIEDINSSDIEDDLLSDIELDDDLECDFDEALNCDKSLAEICKDLGIEVND